MARFNYQYNLSRPYPGRYTTFIVTPLAMIACVMIVLINIPLSAYETRQEFTYTPNSTTNTLPFSYLVPSPLRKHSVQFTPHTFVMGENFQTNLGTFSYSITSAYSRNDTLAPGSSKPNATDRLPSFSYPNSDLSSCDVTYITIMVASPGPGVSVNALISCWSPVFFQFQLSPINSLSSKLVSGLLDMHNVVTATLMDYESSLAHRTITGRVFDSDSFEPLSGFNITYRPCCTTCNETSTMPSYTREANEITSRSDHSLLLYDHPACDDKDVNFKLPSIAGAMISNSPYNVVPVMLYVDAQYGLMPASTVNQLFNGTFNNTPEDFSVLNYNVLRALYHGIRLDLGVIRPNQIYNSPTRFNASISQINSVSMDGHDDSMTNLARGGRDTLDGVNLFTPPYNQRVPKVLYLTSVFTPKPLGQAIAAVFVATFSMITALWHGANFIASSLVTARSEKATFCPCPACQGHDIAFHKVPMQDYHDSEWTASDSTVARGGEDFEAEAAATGPDDSDERKHPQVRGMSETQLRYRSSA